jgi:alpha-beta hydrolase superfamily lysophospholipase
MTRIAELLDAQFTVITYDRRGRGGPATPRRTRSSGRSRTSTRSSPKPAARRYVHGMSSGAVLAAAAAASGLAIGRVALYEAPFVVDDTRAPASAAVPARLADLASSGRRGQTVELFLTTATDDPSTRSGAAPVPR